MPCSVDIEGDIQAIHEIFPNREEMCFDKVHKRAHRMCFLEANYLVFGVLVAIRKREYSYKNYKNPYYY